jgi:hypothetical protein
MLVVVAVVVVMLRQVQEVLGAGAMVVQVVVALHLLGLRGLLIPGVVVGVGAFLAGLAAQAALVSSSFVTQILFRQQHPPLVRRL